ncbi:hypothetical protein [Membranihabitans marinus]|uniref:hypothetical protein n=1 Tax=Membranihabitans marinus TaxID=1227546 RepID=UPI001F2990A7|nr:hypothetical protein [Membranihabitans marinus]
MKYFILKTLGFTIFLLLFLEIIIRILHFYNDVPLRMIDDYGNEKWVPFQEGYFYTGTKKETVSKYRINNFGFNSTLNYSFNHSDTTKIGLFGDSYIEGFNQDVDQSIGIKIMNKIPIICYEFGFSGYDFASIIHLIETNESKFKVLDRIYIYLNNSDFNRSTYTISNHQKERTNTLISTIYRNFKFLMFLNHNGYIKTIKEKFRFHSKNIDKPNYKIHNINQLINNSHIDWSKVIFIIDSSEIDSLIIQKLNSLAKVLDITNIFSKSKYKTNFGYDKHWNNHGRSLISDFIIRNENNYIQY